MYNTHRSKNFSLSQTATDMYKCIYVCINVYIRLRNKYLCSAVRVLSSFCRVVIVLYPLILFPAIRFAKFHGFRQSVTIQKFIQYVLFVEIILIYNVD